MNMNIQEAKEEILRTVRAYREKDETGALLIPAEQQRPILLIGPPGIGKTAIMKQAAEACGIGLVSYTITHHTRQSAIGLPMISHHSFDGQDTAVTEYTMSEIVASVYEKIEKTGIREGILFLDEINCVSETLAPTMLQFLQYKTFGTHRVPEGWVVVTAGNQPQYNRSARKFDVVTLDRVKKMEIEADYGVWKEYALRAGIHGSILSYLETKPQNFYRFRTDLEDRYFVTARGWEDLSRMIHAYEAMGEPVTEMLAVQYLQDPEIARDYSVYYDLYRKYSGIYRVGEILEGKYMPEREAVQDLPFDEKLSLIRLLSDGLHREFMRCSEIRAVQERIFRRLNVFKAEWDVREQRTEEDLPATAKEFRPAEVLEAVRLLQGTGEDMQRELQVCLEAGMLTREAERDMRRTLSAWDELTAGLLETEKDGQKPVWERIRNWFSEREDARMEQNRKADNALTNCFTFLAQSYGSGQEMVLFLTALHEDWYAMQFLGECGNTSYDKYSGLLLLHDRRESLRQEVLGLQI